MSTVFTILIILIILASLLLIGVVLLQNGKGNGLASNFVTANNTLGVRQTTNILEKFTWGLVAFILVLSIIASFNMGGNSNGIDVTKQIESATTTEQPAFPSAPVEQANPAAEASETQGN